MKRKTPILRRVLWFVIIAFILMNIVAIFHAYKFTHFADPGIEKTQKPENLGFGGKIKALFFGVNNPRPFNESKPIEYKKVEIESNKRIECWHLDKADSSNRDENRATVIICHGYGGEKSSMLDKAEIFDSLGYNTFLIDFMGSGGSEGNTTTIGFKEAEQVNSAYEYLKNRGVTNIYLFGTSMGAVAIMKAIKDFNLEPKAVIIECPFGTMYQTVSARFNNMNVPSFPMAGLLVFWGGVQNRFWAFGHDPIDYAKDIDCPVLLLYGEKDKNVSIKEIDSIYKNLPGQKVLKTYPLAGHENYLIKYKKEWTQDVMQFLNDIN